MNNIFRLRHTLLLSLTLYACDYTEPSKQGNSEAHDEPSATLVDSNETTDTKQSQARVEPAIQLAQQAEKNLEKSAFKTIEWTELMPKADRDALSNPPDYINDIEDGSAEDQIMSEIQNSDRQPVNDRYQQALKSTNVVPYMDGQPIRIAGFIVPLEFDDDLTVTQFFLVPYFGACIHMPPPPPNQVIFVDYPGGINLEVLYDPFWISGILKTSLTTNDVATASYSLTMQHFEKY